MRALLAANQPVIHFIYGLALFLMGWTIWMQPRSSSGLRLARSLPYLAAFGILRGLSEWGLLLVPLQAAYLEVNAVNMLHRLTEILMAGSFLSLCLFGCDLLRNMNRRWSWLPLVALTLFGVWATHFLFISAAAMTAAQEQALMVESEVWARYLLVVPGTLLAALGLHLQTRQFKEEGFAPTLPDLRGASIAMVAYCLLAGLLVPRADFFPANLLHTSLFQEMAVLVIFLRSACSAVIAIFLVRTMRVFETELHDRLEKAEAARASVEERERLGLELHDGILQSVYATGLGLQSARKRIHTDPEGAVKRVDTTLDRLNGVIEEIRAYIRSLTASPATFDDLQRAVESAVEQFQMLYGLPVTLTTDLPAGSTTTTLPVQQVMPILQETLSNVGRHASASSVRVHVGVAGGMVSLTVSDDGQGFDPEKALHRQGHYGLRNLHRRTQTEGGTLRIISGPGKGTRVEAILPLLKGEVAS